jgi:hypothetical protein
MALTELEKNKQKRRSLLKVAAGAPVIFTLPTGAALAAASLTCKDKSKALANQTPPKGVVPTSDNWMRHMVVGKKIKIQGDNTVRKGFTLNSKWYRVYVGNGPNSGTVEDITLTRDTSYSPNNPDNGDSYYLLVDQTKHELLPGSPESFVFLGTTDPNFAPIAGHTCWNSISTVSNNLTGNVIN